MNCLCPAPCDSGPLKASVESGKAFRHACRSIILIEKMVISQPHFLINWVTLKVEFNIIDRHTSWGRIREGMYVCQGGSVGLYI